MNLLYFLFYQCAHAIRYDTIGDSVDFKFVEDAPTNSLYIYFQGSNSVIDWIENFLFTKKVYKEFRVHKGFYNAYMQFRDYMLDHVYKHSYKKIVVVGYSHGAALCQLALEDLVYHFPDLDISGYAFESPRCLKVGKKYRDRWKTLVTIRNGTDVVTHCPPKFLGYSDLGRMVNIKGDTSVSSSKLPKFIKYHFPEVVENGLKNLPEEGSKNE